MMRRLRAWYYETRAILASWRRGFRAWMRDWIDLAASPFRAAAAIRPAAIVHETRAGVGEVVAGGRDAARATVSTFLATLRFIALLPVHIVRFVVFGPRRLWHIVRTAPPRLVIIVGVVVVAALGALGTTGLVLWREHRLEARKSLLFRHLDHYLETCDNVEAEKALTALSQLVPDDPTVNLRLEALRTLDAPFGDPKMLRVTMRTHHRQGNYALAAREAAKIIETFPTDWEARCMLADEASRRDDKDEVQRNLALLPRASEVVDSISPWVAWYSAILFHRLGETQRFNEMMDFMTLHVLPLLRSRELILLQPDARLLILECYRIAMTQLDTRPRLVQFWAPAQAVCRSIAESDMAEPRHLLGLAQTQEIHLTFLQEFLRRKLISEADYDAYRQEIEIRLRFVTERLIEKDPKQVHAYVILAENRFRAGQVDAAFETIHRGLKECGPAPELVMDKALLLRRTDPKASLEFLDRVVNLNALNPAMCQIYADVALGAGRPDKALEACRLAHKQQPGLLWAHRREAEICRLLGRTTEAAAALQPIRSYLATDPAGCELYVKTLCDAGSFALAEEFLKEVAAENRPIEVLLKAARGFAEVGRHEDAVRWARIVLERDQTNAPALLILADSLRVLSETGVRGWDRDKVREALRAYRAVLRQQDDNLTVVNNIVWLELKALELPKQAFESALPLRAVQDRIGLPADFMETLGAAYIGVGRFEDARRMLNEAIRTAGPRPGFYIHLAMAHHGLQQPEMAEKYLLKAAELPKTAREIAELTDTIRMIQMTRK